MQLIIFLILTAVVLNSSFAHAYVGPGLGAGAIGVILGFICSILLAIFAIFWYPFKKFLKNIKQKKNHNAKNNEQDKRIQ